MPKKRSQVLLVIAVNILYAIPNLFIKIDIVLLADHALYILTEIRVEQMAGIVANVLFILVNFVRFHLLKGRQLTADESIVLWGRNSAFLVCEDIN